MLCQITTITVPLFVIDATPAAGYRLFRRLSLFGIARQANWMRSSRSKPYGKTWSESGLSDDWPPRQHFLHRVLEDFPTRGPREFVAENPPPHQYSRKRSILIGQFPWPTSTASGTGS